MQERATPLGGVDRYAARIGILRGVEMKRLIVLLLASSLFAQAKFSVVEATIPEMRAAMEQKRVTSRELVTQYLTRIANYDRKLHAVITLNPNALAEPDSCDRERAAGHLRGPLHGIPIALKDNI